MCEAVATLDVIKSNPLKVAFYPWFVYQVMGNSRSNLFPLCHRDLPQNSFQNLLPCGFQFLILILVSNVSGDEPSYLHDSPSSI